MAKISDLTGLFTAVSVGDWVQARALAETIAVAEEQAGHHGAAATLRGALTATGPRPDQDHTPATHSLALTGISPELLTVVRGIALLRDVKLPTTARKALDEVLLENRHRKPLLAHGLQPRNRLFFHGPPGCGKTMTAIALGNELQLPVRIVRFDVLVGAYLGQTAMRVHEVFRYAETHPCILLIDEIDAVGRRRGKASDVGELDRVVISLMQQLDLVRPAGLIVAASNIPEELDLALLRRFDLVVEFPAPSKEELRDFTKQEAAKRGVKLLNGVRHELANAKTFADAQKILEVEQRRAILRRV